MQPVSAAGGRDVANSAEFAEVVARLAAVPERLAAAFGWLQEADAVVHTAPGEWSAAEVLAHLRASHDITEPRILAILARDDPPLTALTTCAGGMPRATSRCP